MLGRRQSIKVGDAALVEPSLASQVSSTGPSQIGGLASQEPANLQQLPVPELGSTVMSQHANVMGASSGTGSGGLAWFNKTSVRHFMRICSVASLLSVCANTSRTFSWYPTLMLITFIVDIITGIVFTIEMVFKIYSRGFLKGSSPYAKDRWCQFDATMVLFIWISILLQVSVPSLITFLLMHISCLHFSQTVSY